MGSNRKPAQMERKAYFERQLKDRMSFLSEKGIESAKIKKDTILKKLRANIDSLNARLKSIASSEVKTEVLAKTKAEKAVLKKEPEDRMEKKAPEAPVEGKEKKKKKEQAVS
jgi:hypothetical protein